LPADLVGTVLPPILIMLESRAGDCGN